MEQEVEMTDGLYEDIKPMFESSPSNEVVVMTRDKLGEIVQAATTGRYYDYKNDKDILVIHQKPKIAVFYSWQNSWTFARDTICKVYGVRASNLTMSSYDIDGYDWHDGFTATFIARQRTAEYDPTVSSTQRYVKYTANVKFDVISLKSSDCADSRYDLDIKYEE